MSQLPRSRKNSEASLTRSRPKLIDSILGRSQFRLYRSGNNTATDITVADASLQGTVSAINEANLGVTAEIMDTGRPPIATEFN